MGLSRTQSIYMTLEPSPVSEILSDPRAWVQCDDQIHQFAPTRMAGDRLQAGDTVKIVPKALIRGFVHAVTAPAARIVTAREQRELTWRQNQPGGYTQQRWLIEPAGNGTTLTRQTHVVGPL